MFKKKRLDYLVIPDSSGKSKKQRSEAALKAVKERDIGKTLILGGKNSEEDILYLGKIVEPGERIGFDTFSLHFREYKEIIKKAKKQGKFPRKVKIENISYPSSFKQIIYGILGLEEEKLMHKRIEYSDKTRRPSFIRNLVKKLLS